MLFSRFLFGFQIEKEGFFVKKSADLSVRRLVTAAVFAALTAAVTMIHVPSVNGYIHLGDAMIYLCASCLPSGTAFASAAIGGSVADLISGYPIWAPFTFVIKGLLTLAFSSKSGRILTVRNAVCSLAAIAISTLGYCFGEGILYGFAAGIAAIWGNLVQSVGSMLLYLILAFALDRLQFKKRFFRSEN